MTDLDDRDLLGAVAARDRAAFAELFRRWGPRLHGFLRKALPADRAEEVAQEVLLRIWRRASSYDPERAAPATWIFSIARNARIDALRRAGRSEPDPTDASWVPAAPEAPDAVARRLQQAERLGEALDQLPAEQAEVIRLVYTRGLSMREAAEELDLPMGTVKSRVRLAMQRLRLVVPEL